MVDGKDRIVVIEEWLALGEVLHGEHVAGVETHVASDEDPRVVAGRLGERDLAKLRGACCGVRLWLEAGVHGAGSVVYGGELEDVRVLVESEIELVPVEVVDGGD